MANTTNYKFTKPIQADYYDIDVQNVNWDKADAEIKKANDKITTEANKLNTNKQDKLISGTNIKTINGQSLLGSGDIHIKGGTLSEEVTAKKADVLKGKTTVMNDSADAIVEGTLEVQSIVNFNLSLYASETVMGAWQNPAKGPYSGVKIVFRTDRYPNSPTDGEVIYEGNGISFTHWLQPDVKVYFSAFSYMTTNYGRFYNEVPSKAEFTAIRLQGRQVFTSNGIFTVPNGVREIEIFAVGGGGGGGNWFTNDMSDEGPGGGGGGYTSMRKIATSPGTAYNVTVGSGGAPYNWGGTSSFGNIVSAGGGQHGDCGSNRHQGGNGGSGGGAGGEDSGVNFAAGSGGADGNDGGCAKYTVQYRGIGQHSTTKDWNGTLYAGGGGGGAGTDRSGINRYKGGAGGAGGGGRGGDSYWRDHPDLTACAGVAGTPGTGGGGGAGGSRVTGVFPNESNGAQKGGSGVVIVRWGY